MGMLMGTLIHLGVTLGLFAPDPNQGPEDPGPATGEITLLGISTVSACRAGVTEGLKASGPRKPGKSEGESKLSPTDYSLAFPGCKASVSPDAKHPGWRLRRRARSTTAPSSSSAFLSATVETNLIPSVKQYPLNGSRGRSPLVRGYGGRTGPCFVSLGELKCPIQLFSYPISVSFPRAIFRPVFLSKSTAALWNAMLTLASTG